MHFTIVSYTFPPSQAIGGRRWAKFSQQLVKKGHQVTVVCADNSCSSDWYQKEFPKTNIRQLPKCYPEWLSGYTNNILEKFLYLLYTRIFTHFTKKNLFDKGFAWRKPMLKALEEIHKSIPIDVLVVTGAPFSLFCYGAEFKTLHKEIKYVTDFRDPWTWSGGYGLADFSPKKIKYQKDSELMAMELSDMVCCPTQNMIDVLRSMYPSFSSKLYLLTHAYDPDKFPSKSQEVKREGFIYGGTLYHHIEDYIKSLNKIVKANPGSNFKWDVYSGTNYPLIDSGITGEFIKKHALLTEEQLFQKIMSAAAYLIIFPKSAKNLISTKFFEIVYTGTPILYIGDEGVVGRFITENRLGVHILPENMERDLPKYLNGNVPFEFGYFDVSKFSFSKVTEDFIGALKNF